MLGSYLPDQAPTAASYRAWRDANGFEPQTTRLYAASRTAYLPNQPGHAEHGTRIPWFPGGTITPVASLLTPQERHIMSTDTSPSTQVVKRAAAA